MKEVIECLSVFVSKKFNIQEKDLYSESKKDCHVIARYMTWHILHCHYGVSSGVLSKEFFRTRRAVFFGIRKIKSEIKNKKIYKEMYGNLYDEFIQKNGKKFPPIF